MRRLVCRLILFLILVPGALVIARQGAPGPRQLRARALEGVLQSQGEESLATFIDAHLAPALVESLTRDGVVRLIKEIRAAAGDFGGVLYRPVGSDGLRITFLDEDRETSVLLRIEADPPNRIAALALESGKSGESGKPDQAAGTAAPPLTWENLEAQLAQEEQGGFSGTVLVAHEGKIVLHRGYGMADRERKIPNDTETIFAIGSVPIDFTRAAILKLEEQGRLQTSDPIGRFVEGVPEDKRAMTIDHILRSASGLPDFHHINGVDADPDLTWIDRRTAIDRILKQPLLFPPGKDEAHSHSAWVLLAAIVELASGQEYGEYLQRNLFEPAGMTHTGLHEDAVRFPDRQFAIGYGHNAAGRINIPRYWGRTSWLVMGSGGMQSTPMDLYRWVQAIRGGRLLSKETVARYWRGGVLAGGDDRGFFCLYTDGPGDLFVLSSNAHRIQGDRAGPLGKRLVRLVMPATKAG